MTDLADAVHALTRPVTYHHETQNGPHESTLPCLLDRLEQAVYSSTSGKAGGGSPSGRSVLDSGAMFQAGIIRISIVAWCRSVGLTAPKRLADALEAWLRAVTDGEHHAWAIRELDRWRDQITRMLNPMKPFQYAVPCPVCDATTWTDPEGNTRHWPLNAEYDPDDLAGTATVECRACDTTWTGDGIGELIEEVEAKIRIVVEQSEKV